MLSGIRDVKGAIRSAYYSQSPDSEQQLLSLAADYFRRNSPYNLNINFSLRNGAFFVPDKQQASREIKLSCEQMQNIVNSEGARLYKALSDEKTGARTASFPAASPDLIRKLGLVALAYSFDFQDKQRLIEDGPIGRLWSAENDGRIDAADVAYLASQHLLLDATMSSLEQMIYGNCAPAPKTS